MEVKTSYEVFFPGFKIGNLVEHCNATGMRLIQTWGDDAGYVHAILETSEERSASRMAEVERLLRELLADGQGKDAASDRAGNDA